jgi:2-keto-4-pentenoate hydratase/2-oxohepta-3-ene-1,7-dioic acid hydratase in catechol pathway
MSAGTVIEFQVQEKGGVRPLTARIGRLVIAGWTGRDRAAMEAHIEELEALGVKRPAATPIFYRVSARRLTQDGAIEVPGGTSSGEVEVVLLRTGAGVYVGVGSDHTDRAVETYGITVSKQMCDKPLAAVVWPLEEVRAHWDQLRLRSWILEQGGEATYQEGSLEAMLHVDTLLAAAAEAGEDLAEGTVMFCGTLAAAGGIRPAVRFGFELSDPVLGRRIAHEYAVRELAVRG